MGSCWSFSPLCIRETTVYVYCVYQTQTHLGLIWAASKFTAQLWHWQNSQHIWHLAYVRQTCDCRNVGDIDWYSCCVSFAPTHWQERQRRLGKYFTFKGKDQRVITVLQKGNANNVTVRKYFQFSEAHKGLASKNKFIKFQFTVKSTVLSFSNFPEISLLVCLREPELFERVIFFQWLKKNFLWYGMVM